MISTFFILAILNVSYSSSQEAPAINPVDRAGATADPETTTPEKCECTSTCRASVDSFYSTDWCYTADSCGHYTFGYGYWDYCLYLDSQKPQYVSMDWTEKQAYLWSKIKEDDTMAEYDDVHNLFTKSVKTTFDNEWDVMPEGRKRVIHGVGVICKFEIGVASDSPYTGLLKAGANVHGLVRLSWALDPYSSGSGKDLIPGVAIKFLVSGESSVNFVAQNSLNPLPNNNFNFFALNNSNHLLPSSESSDPLMELAKMMLVKKFCQAGPCLNKVGISHLTTHEQDGVTVDKPVFPFKISLVPADVQLPETAPSTLSDYVKQFTVIPAGTALFKVIAHSDPDDNYGSFIANMVTTDNCVSSKFGDTKLFFRHMPIENDIEMKPEWTVEYQATCKNDQVC